MSQYAPPGRRVVLSRLYVRDIFKKKISMEGKLAFLSGPVVPSSSISSPVCQSARLARGVIGKLELAVCVRREPIGNPEWLIQLPELGNTHTPENQKTARRGGACPGVAVWQLPIPAKTHIPLLFEDMCDLSANSRLGVFRRGLYYLGVPHQTNRRNFLSCTEMWPMI